MKKILLASMIFFIASCSKEKSYERPKPAKKNVYIFQMEDQLKTGRSVFSKEIKVVD